MNKLYCFSNILLPIIRVKLFQGKLNVVKICLLACLFSACSKEQTNRIYVPQAVDLEIKQIDGKSAVIGSSAFQVPGHFVWGGSVEKGKDGKFYMIYTAIETGVYPFNDAWVLGSKFGLAVSDRPDGGFRHLGFFLNKDGFRPDSSSWDAQMVHNPHVRKFGDKYYLYYIGSKDRGNEGVVAEGDTLPRRHRVQQFLSIGVLEFESFTDLLSGKFKHFDRPILTARTRVKSTDIINPSPMGTIVLPDNIIVCNPSVVYRPDDGKYLMYFKGNRYDPEWRGVHGVAMSESPVGPFVAKDFTVFEIAHETKRCSAEDPYVWYSEKEGKFFAVLKDFNGAYTGLDGPGLALMESEDGINWSLSQNPLFMKKELILKSGDTIQVNRLERPQLYINEEGIPEVLYAACAIDPVNGRMDGGSFNVQIPLKMSESSINK